MSRQTTLFQTWGYDEKVDDVESLDPFDDGNDAILLSMATEEKLEGFDVDAGRNYVYPMNYPLRQYQFEMVKTALFTNTLISLPTGLGKTFIAAVVMYNFFRWYPKAKIVFMAPTRPLVSQQIEACFNIMGLPQSEMIEMTGGTKIKDRRQLWLEKRIFFLTPQVMSNDLSRDLFPASDVKLLVVDEAHRAQGDYAYCAVVRELVRYSMQFRVLALSATPGSDLIAVRAMLQNLRISKIELRTEESPDVSQYTFQRNVQKIVVPLGQELESMRCLFLQILEHFIKKLASKGALARRSNSTNPTTYTKFGLLQARNEFRQCPPGRLQRSEIGIVEADFASTISLYHGFELLSQHGMRSTFNFMMKTLEGPSANKRLLSILNQLPSWRELYKNLSSKFKEDTEHSRLNTSRPHLLSQFSQNPSTSSVPSDTKDFVIGHPKLERLRDIVVDHFKAKEEEGVATRVMIFAQYRDSVVEIAACLHAYRPRIRVMEFVGQAGIKGGKKGLTQKEQIEVVRRFRDNGYNTLVATCVGEEGLDIGEVDLIICYDVSKSPIRIVQRMGRTGRKRAGRIVVLVTEGKEDVTYDQSMSCKKSINKAILERSKLEDALCTSPRMVPSGLQPQCIKTEMHVGTAFDKNFGKAKEGRTSGNINRDGKRKRNNDDELDGSFNEEKKVTFESKYKIDEEDVHLKLFKSCVKALLNSGDRTKDENKSRQLVLLPNISEEDFSLSLKMAELFYHQHEEHQISDPVKFESTRCRILSRLSTTLQMSNSELEYYEKEMLKKIDSDISKRKKKSISKDGVGGKLAGLPLPSDGFKIIDNETAVSTFRLDTELDGCHPPYEIRPGCEEQEDDSVEIIQPEDDEDNDCLDKSLPPPFNLIKKTVERIKIKKPPPINAKMLPSEADFLIVDVEKKLALFGFKVKPSEDQPASCIKNKSAGKIEFSDKNSPFPARKRLEVHFASPIHQRCHGSEIAKRNKEMSRGRLTSTPASKHPPNVRLDETHGVAGGRNEDDMDVFGSDDDLWLESAVFDNHNSSVDGGGKCKEETLLNESELAQQLQMTTITSTSPNDGMDKCSNVKPITSIEGFANEDKFDDDEDDAFFMNIDSHLFQTNGTTTDTKYVTTGVCEKIPTCSKRKQQDDTNSPLPSKKTRALRIIDSSEDETLLKGQHTPNHVRAKPKGQMGNVAHFFDQEAKLDEDCEPQRVVSSDESLADNENDAYEASFVDDNHLGVSATQKARYLQSVKSPLAKPLLSSKAANRRKIDVCSQPLLDETEDESYDKSFVTSDVEYKSELIDTLDLAEAGKLDLSGKDEGTTKIGLRIIRRMNESSEDETGIEEEKKPKPLIEDETDEVDEAKAQRLKRQKELQEAFRKKFAHKMGSEQEGQESKVNEEHQEASCLKASIETRSLATPSSSMLVQLNPSSSRATLTSTASGSPPIVLSTSSVNRSHELVSQLRHTHKLSIIHRKLSTSSIIISYRVGVERIALSSFVNCTNRAMLLNLVQSMNDSFERPCLIVELDSDSSILSLQSTVKRTRYADNVMAQISQSNLQLFFSNSQSETACIVSDLYSSEIKKGHGLSLRASQLTDQDEQMVSFYEQLPGVGFSTALRLLLSFTSLRSFLMASKEEMRAKANINEAVAKAIFDFVNDDCRN